MEGRPGDFFASVVDASPDGILLVDGDGTITFANPQAEVLFGQSGADLVGTSVDDLLPTDVRGNHAAHRAGYQAHPAVRPMGVGLLLRARRGDGREIPVEISLSPLPGPGPVQVVAAVRDVTARVEAEAEVRRVTEALRQAEQVMAVATDRERIARDLHDTVIQRLFASGLALQALATRVDGEAGGRLAAIVTDLDETIREIRTAIFGLQPPAVGPAGVRTRVVHVVAEATPGLGFEPRLRFDGAVETLPDEVAVHLLATLREALANAARHAGATEVSVRLEVDAHRARLVVEDDGIGLAVAADRGGRGLENMAARAEALGGTFDAKARQPAGTVLTWTATF